MNAFLRTVFATAALSLIGGAASAQDCPTEPVFVGVSSSNADVRASASRVGRGEWSVAEHFATEAINSGTSARNKAAAYVNLCAALAGQRSAGAAEACSEAVTRRERWEAVNNRGAAFWLAGDLQAATADFARAAELAPSEEAVVSNNALLACSS